MSSKKPYRKVEDPGHGWLEVPVQELFDLGIAEEISGCSYLRDDKAYLEEDRDMSIFLDAIAKRYTTESEPCLELRQELYSYLIDHLDLSKESYVRQYEHYSHESALAHKGDETVKIAVTTRHPDAIVDYLGFGNRIIEFGENQFGDTVVILLSPPQHADWQIQRLCSGLHGARLADNWPAYCDEWGYKKGIIPMHTNVHRTG